VRWLSRRHRESDEHANMLSYLVRAGVASLSAVYSARRARAMRQNRRVGAAAVKRPRRRPLSEMERRRPCEQSAACTAVTHCPLPVPGAKVRFIRGESRRYIGARRRRHARQRAYEGTARRARVAPASALSALFILNMLMARVRVVTGTVVTRS